MYELLRILEKTLQLQQKHKRISLAYKGLIQHLPWYQSSKQLKQQNK